MRSYNLFHAVAATRRGDIHATDKWRDYWRTRKETCHQQLLRQQYTTYKIGLSHDTLILKVRNKNLLATFECDLEGKYYICLYDLSRAKKLWECLTDFTKEDKSKKSLLLSDAGVVALTYQHAYSFEKNVQIFSEGKAFSALSLGGHLRFAENKLFTLWQGKIFKVWDKMNFPLKTEDSYLSHYLFYPGDEDTLIVHENFIISAKFDSGFGYSDEGKQLKISLYDIEELDGLDEKSDHTQPQCHYKKTTLTRKGSLDSRYTISATYIADDKIYFGLSDGVYGMGGMMEHAKPLQRTRIVTLNLTTKEFETDILCDVEAGPIWNFRVFDGCVYIAKGASLWVCNKERAYWTTAVSDRGHNCRHVSLNDTENIVSLSRITSRYTPSGKKFTYSLMLFEKEHGREIYHENRYCRREIADPHPENLEIELIDGRLMYFTSEDKKLFINIDDYTKPVLKPQLSEEKEEAPAPAPHL